MEKIIESYTNTRYKNLKKLQTRKGRERQGRFLMEGPVVLKELMNHPLCCEFYIKESMKEGLHQLIEDAKKLNLPITYLKDELFNDLSMTEQSQGMIGVFKSPIKAFNSENISGKWVYLDGIQDPGNLGGIIRSANAFHAKGILLGPGTVDPLNDKVVRSTMASLLKLPIYKIDDEQLEELSNRIPMFVMDLDGSQSVESLSKFPNLILVLGNEAKGIRPWIKSLSKYVITIPINSDVDSLNVNVAGSIAMYFFEERS